MSQKLVSQKTIWSEFSRAVVHGTVHFIISFFSQLYKQDPRYLLNSFQCIAVEKCEPEPSPLALMSLAVGANLFLRDVGRLWDDP